MDKIKKYFRLSVFCFLMFFKIFIRYVDFLFILYCFRLSVYFFKVKIEYIIFMNFNLYRYYKFLCNLK